MLQPEPPTVERCLSAIKTIAHQCYTYGNSAHRQRLLTEWQTKLAAAQEREAPLFPETPNAPR